ncbi:MAG TPA: DUF5655 domain-containing protein [Vicinamibacterales bacterium]|nr:DUF5655 domain-containing protein [Vicinamibacterales bacterium]
MPGRECYHCKAWIEEGQAHDCWTTTESALTADLSEDLLDAWERLRETAVEFGAQRIYASGRAIMFSRDVCYFFVRPKRQFLELVFFLGRSLKAPQVRRVDRTSKVKTAHVVHLRHRDEVESPITDWLKEAYDLPDTLAMRPKLAKPNASKTQPTKPKPTPHKSSKPGARKQASGRSSNRPPGRSKKRAKRSNRRLH